MTTPPVGVLGVHGVHSHQPGLTPEQASARIAGWWKDALLAGLDISADDSSRLLVDVAYYAHRLHTGTAQGDEEPDLLPDDLQQQIIEWARLLGAPDATAQGWLTAPARAAIAWIARHHGLDHRPLSILTNALFREVNRYFTDPEARVAARTEVCEAIERTHPRVLIAHSLGSVLAYEALWTHEHPPIELFLTLGSPLAIPGIVYDRLADHPGPRARPPGVTRWINLADPGDVIAIPRGDIPRRFTGATDHPTKQIGLFSYHQATKYLAGTATAEILAAHLSLTERFRVRRGDPRDR